MASWRPTGKPQELPERESRGTWTFACISFVESHLREGSPERDDEDDPPHGDTKTEMPPEAGADDAPSESATAPVPGSHPSEDPAMEVDKGAVGPPPTSPISRDNDDLLSGNVAAGVEAGLAHLTVSSPSGQEVEGEEASHAEAPPPPEKI